MDERPGGGSAGVESIAERPRPNTDLNDSVADRRLLAA